MPIAKKSLTELDADIRAIMHKQVTDKDRIAECKADADRFRNTLHKLAQDNPWALKEYLAKEEGINVTIDNNHILGFYEHWSWGYTHDQGLTNYIERAATNRSTYCQNVAR